jgi:predicted ATPase/DNA-binding SARP family transcriptional activator
LDGQIVSIKRRKALALLIYLAITRQPHSRETLATFFWPDTEQSRAFAYLRTTLWTLRKSIDDDLLETEQDNVSLSEDVELWMDTAEFEYLVEASADISSEERVNQLTHAVELFQDDFLAGFTLPDTPAFDDWQYFQFEGLRQTLSDGLKRLVDCLIQRGDFGAAVPYAQRRLMLDPLLESAHRELMRLYYWSNQRSRALRLYQECVRLLRAELDVEPEAQTTELYTVIQGNRLETLPGVQPAPEEPVAKVAPAEDAPVLPPIRGQLPTQSTTFVGRQHELAEIEQFLEDENCRLLTIVGQGGIGKTRLALQLAQHMKTQYADGVYFVNLAPVTAIEYILPAIADALNVTADRRSDIKTQLFSYLQQRNVLLVLDNFEHLLEGATLIDDMLRATSQVKVLVTSRERLHLHGEWIFDLHGLSYPRSGELVQATKVIETYDAIRLFLQSARRVRPDFALSENNLHAASRICALVEGMPLGIELAGAWVQMLAPDDIASEIERSLDFLSAELRNLPLRHRSIRAVLESSWERLSTQQKHVLKRLSVFRGGFTLDAARVVSDATPLLLRALHNQSLIQRDIANRYTMHELLRQFAREKLEVSIEKRDELFECHGLYYVDYLKQREPMLKDFRQIDALDEIDREMDNIRVAWYRAVERRNFSVLDGMLTGLMLFYIIRTRFRETTELFGYAVNTLESEHLLPENRVVLAKIMVLLAAAYRYTVRDETIALYQKAAPLLERYEGDDAAIFHVMLGNMGLWPVVVPDVDPLDWYGRARQLFEAQGDRWGIATAIYGQAIALHNRMQYEQARTLHQEALTIRNEIGDYWGIGSSLSSLGAVAYTLGEYAEAERLCREGRTFELKVGDMNSSVWSALQIATTLGIQGDFEAAQLYMEESLKTARQLGNMNGVAWAIQGLGDIAVGQLKLEEAAGHYEESLRLFEENQSDNGRAWALMHQSKIAWLRGHFEEAMKLARRSFENLDPEEDPWRHTSALYYLGEAALGLGDIDAARQHLRKSIQVAVNCRSIMLLLRHAVGVARLYAREDQVEQAIELLAFVAAHPASWQETKNSANRLLDELKPSLSDDKVRVAKERGEAMTVEVAVARMLPAK